MSIAASTASFFTSLLAIGRDAAPWLVLGLAMAGLLKAFLPMALVLRWLGRGGVGAIVRAAVVGTPLPLCSCSVLPVAMGLRRAGAGKGATVSFLVATPENGVDSIALSYALLGPFMAAARIVAALAGAIAAGLLATAVDRDLPRSAPSAGAEAGCGCRRENPCNAAAASPVAARPGSVRRAWNGVVYAFTDLWCDMAAWLLAGLVVSAFVQAFVPSGALAAWGHGPLAMALMVLLGLPMYVCASASTPIAAAMIAAGVSPGTALVFLLAGPATNIGSLAVVRRELGNRTAAAYLVGAAVVPVLLGLATDALAVQFGVSVAAQLGVAGETVPAWLQDASLLVLGGATISATARRFVPDARTGEGDGSHRGGARWRLPH